MSKGTGGRTSRTRATERLLRRGAKAETVPADLHARIMAGIRASRPAAVLTAPRPALTAWKRAAVAAPLAAAALAVALLALRQPERPHLPAPATGPPARVPAVATGARELTGAAQALASEPLIRETDRLMQDVERAAGFLLDCLSPAARAAPSDCRGRS